MAIIRRTNNWLPSIFNDFFGNEWMESNTKLTPAINIKQDEKGFIVEVAAPGMQKEDCNITIEEDNNLIISFEKKNQSEDKDEKGTYLRREFSYTQFQRRMILPDNVEKDKITANVENGILTITIPELKEKEKITTSRRIEIQ